MRDATNDDQVTSRESDALRSATFAEKQVPSAPEPGQDQPFHQPMYGEETRALSAQWRVFARFATGVAVLTAPVFFLVLYRALGWSAVAAGLVAQHRCSAGAASRQRGFSGWPATMDRPAQVVVKILTSRDSVHG